MGIRAFLGVQTIAATNTAQPCFGTTLSAAVNPPPDPFSGNLNPGSNQTQVTLPVASTKGFLPGDYVAVGPAADFKPGIATARPDTGQIKSITDGTHMVVQNLQNVHASGEYVILNETVGNVHIVPVGGTANDAMYLGNASTVTATDISVFDVLAVPAHPGLPTYAHDSESIGMSQPLNTVEYWIYGTNPDTFCCRFTVI